MSAKYDQLFFEKGKEYGVDPMILKGIASVESNFNPKAVGPKTRYGSAQGMMQFIPAMQKPYGITDPFDPEQSVTGAARMMSDLLKRYKGDVGKALEAYNGGPRLVGKSTQTRKYAEKVQRKAQLFAKSTQKPSIEVAGTPTQAPSALSRTPQVAQQTPKFNVGTKTVAQGPSLDGMSEDYKAALALSYLTEDDSDGLTVTERAEQMLADQEEADSIRGDALSQMFSMEDAGIAEQDPFAVYAAAQNPQPPVQQAQAFADGGFVFGGTSLAGAPNPMLRPLAFYNPELKRLSEEIEQKNKAYEAEAGLYNKDVEDYNKAYNEWLNKANTYNQAVDALGLKENIYNSYVNVYNEYMLNNPNAPSFEDWARNPTFPGLDAGTKRIAEFKLGKDPGKQGSTINPFPGNPETWQSNLPVKPTEWKGTLARTAPTLGYDPKEVEARMKTLGGAYERELADAEKYGKQRELALDVVSNPEAYNLAGMGFADGGPVIRMAAGGDPMAELLREFDGYIANRQYTKAQVLLDDTVDRYGMDINSSYENMANYLKEKYPDVFRVLTKDQMLKNRASLQPFRDYVNETFQQVLNRSTGKEGAVNWTEYLYNQLGGASANRRMPGGVVNVANLRRVTPDFSITVANGAGGIADQYNANKFYASKGINKQFDLSKTLPSNWTRYTPEQKIAWYNSNSVTPEMLTTAGVSQADINWMSQRGYTGNTNTGTTTNKEAERRREYEQLLTSTFQNVLGRAPVAGSPGQKAWLEQLMSGAVSPKNLAKAVAYGASDDKDRIAADRWALGNLGKTIFGTGNTNTGITTGITTGTTTNKEAERRREYEQLLTSTFQNVLGRAPVAGSPGQKAWLEQLMSGAVSPENLAKAVAYGASDDKDRIAADRWALGNLGKTIFGTGNTNTGNTNTGNTNTGNTNTGITTGTTTNTKAQQRLNIIRGYVNDAVTALQNGGSQVVYNNIMRALPALMDQYGVTPEEFARAFPEPEWKNTWGNASWLQTNYTALKDQMARKPEYERLLKSTFQNVLGRDPVAGSLGQEAWLDQLMSGAVSPDDLAKAVAYGASDDKDKIAADRWALDPSRGNLGKTIFGTGDINTGNTNTGDINTGNTTNTEAQQRLKVIRDYVNTAVTQLNKTGNQDVYNATISAIPSLMDQYGVTPEEFAKAFPEPEWKDTWGNASWLQTNYNTLKNQNTNTGGTNTGGTNTGNTSTTSVQNVSIGSTPVDPNTPYKPVGAGTTKITFPTTEPQQLSVAAPVGYQMKAPVIPNLQVGVASNAKANVPVYQVPNSGGFGVASNDLANVPIIRPVAMQQGGEVKKPYGSDALETVRKFLEETDWRGVGKGALDIMLNPPTTLLAGLKGTGWPSALAIGLYPDDLNANEDELLARYRAIAERERSTAQPPMAGRSEGSPPFGESVDPMFSGIDTEGAPVSPVDTAVSQYISNQSKLFTDPQAWGQKFLENVEKYHGKPLRENPEEYLMGQLGPGAIPGVGILGAIKPRGGIMELGMQNNRMGGVTEPNVPVPVDTVAKAALLAQKDGMGNPLSQDHIDDIVNFVEKKYGDYLTKEFGTENDPVRKAIISGRMYKEDVKDPDTGKWRKEQKITKNLSPVFERDSQLYATVDEIQDLVLAKKFAETNPEEFSQLARNPENKLYGYSEDSLQGSIDYKTNAANMYYDLLTNIHPVVYMSDKTLGKVDEVDFRDVVKLFTKFPTIDAATTARALDLKQFPGITDEGIAAAKRMADSLVKSAKLMEAEGADRPLETLLSNMYIQRVYNPKTISFEAGQKAVDNEIVFRLDESRPMLGSLNPDEIVKTLSLVDRNKLKNMSFGQAMVDGLKKIESSRNYNEVLLNTKAGRSVPREKLFLFTTPMQQVGSGKFGRQWVKLDDSRQAEVEGNLMKHSSGGYNKDDGYNLGGKKAFDEGAAKLFSLRSMETGKPSITIEYGHDINTKSRYEQPDEDLIRQIRGKFNSAPISDITEILEFAKQNNLSFPKGREEYYEYSKTGEQLADPIKIKWDQLLQAYKQPNFQVVAYKQLGEPTRSWTRVGGDESPSILITSADDPAYKGLEKVTDVKFAKGGMVDKPLYDRAA